MASSCVGIAASISRACSTTHHLTEKRLHLRAGLATNIITPNVDGLRVDEKQEKSSFLSSDGARQHGNEIEKTLSSDGPRFSDERWKNGTWDLNMFVKNGRMDWDAIIVAEAKRRKFLEVHPEASTNEEPVHFRSSVIPLWAWIVHSHLPEAELLNGQTAMLGFFAAYLVDALTGFNVVSQTGNFICKVALFFTILGVLLLRQKEDVWNLRKLVDETSFYDKQWQMSWKDRNDVQDS